MGLRLVFPFLQVPEEVNDLAVSDSGSVLVETRATTKLANSTRIGFVPLSS